MSITITYDVFKFLFFGSCEKNIECIRLSFILSGRIHIEDNNSNNIESDKKRISGAKISDEY